MTTIREKKTWGMNGFDLNQFRKQIFKFILLKRFGIQKNESNFQQPPDPFPCIQKGKEKRYQKTLEQGDNASEVSYIRCVRKRKISEKGHHTLSNSSLILRKKNNL